MGSHHYHRLTSSLAGILLLFTLAIVSPEITSAQTRIISLSGDLDFGSMPLGTSSQRTLIISNLGDSVLTVSHLDYPPEPVLLQVNFEGNFSGPIEPGASVYIPIIFTPLGTAINGGTNDLDFQGYLSVESDATAGTNSILMSGVGTWPPLTSSLNLDFGTVPLGQSQQMTLSITNTGSTSVTISNANLPDAFTFPFWTSATIAPGTATNLFVTFFPRALTNYQETALFTSDTTDPVLVLITPSGNVTNSADGSLAFSVSGTGTDPSGNFLGLFMPTNNPSFENSGYFTAESTTKGKFRATLTLAGKRYPFSAQISPSATVSATIKRKKLPDLNVSLQFGNGFFSRDWTGTIDDGTWTAQLTAEPAPLLSKLSIRSIPSGKYAISIAGSTNSAVGPTTPGTGTLALKVSDVTRVTGTLGDGTKYSQNTILCTPNHIPFYAPLYGHRGAILGWIAFAHVPVPPPIIITRPPGLTNPPVAFPSPPPSTIINIPPVLRLPQPSTEIKLQIIGTLHWFKPAGIDRDYPDGFSLQTTVTGSASQ